MEIASALVALGEAKKDPLLLGAAAKILSGINGKVADPKASQAAGKIIFYDVGKIVEQAKSFAGDKDLLDEIPSDQAAGMRLGSRHLCFVKSCPTLDPFYMCTYYPVPC